MTIDWPSADALYESGASRYVFDTATRQFLSNDSPEQWARNDAEPERYLEVALESEFPSSLFDEAPLLFSASDPALRGALLEAHDALEAPFDGTDGTARRNWRAEQKRHKQRLDGLIARDARLQARWDERYQRTWRDAVWRWVRANGERLGATESETPPWLAENQQERAALEDSLLRLQTTRLNRIERWLQSNASWEANAPASDEALEHFETSLDVQLPPGFRALYRWHDGSRTPLIHNLSLMPLEKITAARAALTELLHRGDFADKEPTWWQDDWVPILDRGNGDFWVLGEKGHGCVIEFLHDSSRRQILFFNVDAFIDAYTRSIDAGLWTYDGGLEPHDWLNWCGLCNHHGRALGRLDEQAP